MRIGVIGGGAWGTALAMVASRAGHESLIIVRNSLICDEINLQHHNSKYLPGITLPSEIKSSINLKDILDRDALFLVIPAQDVYGLCVELQKLNLDSNKILIICSKGIEKNSLKLMSEVVKDVLPHNPVAILSGPNFALEVALDMPAVTSIASEDIDLANGLAKFFASPNFRIYPNDDIIGTQIMGAAKNVLAIATGIAIGKNYGENAKAAIISRGISEITNLALAKGGKIETLVSPAGIGDIYLTCSSSTSRNTSYGIAIGQGKEINRAVLVEGIASAESIIKLANMFEIQMPICHAVYKIAHENMALEKAVQELLGRPLKI
jgi:glycerol-3-phosphate dehydrogenase (NAD(P)+)